MRCYLLLLKQVCAVAQQAEPPLNSLSAPAGAPAAGAPGPGWLTAAAPAASGWYMPGRPPGARRDAERPAAVQPSAWRHSQQLWHTQQVPSELRCACGFWVILACFVTDAC